MREFTTKEIFCDCIDPEEKRTFLQIVNDYNLDRAELAEYIVDYMIDGVENYLDNVDYFGIKTTLHQDAEIIRACYACHIETDSPADLLDRISNILD